MAFEVKKWKNRIVEHPGRRTLTNAGNGEQMVVDVARNEGLVSEEGDMFNDDNMNGLEQRIKAALDALETSFRNGCSVIANKITACGVATASNAGPATMADNIQSIYNNRYSQGFTDGKNNSQSSWVSLPFTAPTNGMLYAVGVVHWSGSGNFRGRISFRQNGAEVTGYDLTRSDGSYKWHAYWESPQFSINATQGSSYDITLSATEGTIGLEGKRAVFIHG